MNYQAFSKIYDDLMDDQLYSQWLAYTNKHVSKHSNILELAMGTGDLAIKLAKQGYDIVGLDLSSDMLTIAQQKQIEAGISFPLIERNMLDLEGVGSFDAVTCYSDSICYLKDEEELDRLFKQVYSILNSTGTFLFDVHSIFKIQEFIDFSYHNESENGLFIWDSFEGDKPHSIEHDLSFFIPNNDGTYERHDELHKERTYPVKNYIELLEKNNFHSIEVVSDFEEDFQQDGLRWLFKAKK